MVLDTSCNNLVVVKRELFSTLDKSVKSLVKFSNNSNIFILGKDQISIKLKDGSQNFVLDFFFFLCSWSLSQFVKYMTVVRERL